MILLILFTIIAIYAVHYYLKNREYNKILDGIPGLKTYPIIGNVLDLGTTPVDINNGIFRAWNKLGRQTFKIMIGPQPMVFICTPENVEFLLSTNNYSEKSSLYSYLHSWIGEGLLTAKSGPKWHAHRKIITPAFHFKILEQFVEIFNKEADILTRKLSEHVGKANGVDIYPLVSLATLDSICETAMGIAINAQEKHDTEYANAVAEICVSLHKRMFNPFLSNNFIFNLTSTGKTYNGGVEIMHKVTNEVLERRKKELKKDIEAMNKSGESKQETMNDIGMKKRLAFLDLLLLSTTPDGKPLSDQAITDETNTFMFEGHDTTSSGVAFTLYALAKNPEIQDKILEEQRQIIGDDFSGEMNLRSCQDMNYLDRVIKESMRMYPPVPIFGRNLLEHTKFPSGHVIPKGANVGIAPALMHMNPDYFPNPTKFDPDRFLPENMIGKHPYVYLPFSAGPRNCIGQKFAMLEMKCTIAKILQKVKLVELKDFDIKPTMDITLKSGNGIRLGIEKRN